MKSITFISFEVLSVILLSACTDEGHDIADTGTETIKTTLYKSIDTAAANKANAYDHLGKRYAELQITYKSGVHQPSDFAAIEVIVQTLMDITPTAENSLSKQILLSSCMSDPQQALNDILTASDLSGVAKGILSALIGDFDALSVMPFDQAYDNILAIENAVTNSNTIPLSDQRVILTMASIMRYSLYQSCCGDTDWGKSVGNIVAAMGGAVQNGDLAIEYALITSIAGLEKIQI